jgi:hypothetical protein
MRVFRGRPTVRIALVLALAVPAGADTSPPRRGVDYHRFVELERVGAWGAWYIAPGGRFVANQSGADVALIDVATGREHGSLKGHAAGVHDAGFSSNGKLVATAGQDATVKVWDLATLKELRSIDAHAG